MKKRLFTYLKVAVSVLLISILLYIMRDKYGQILQIFKNINILIFCLALALFLGATSLASLRLQLIARAQEISASFKEALYLTFMGYFFNNFLPTTIGGDFVKAYYIARGQKDKLGSFTAVFVDRIIGLLTMVLMASIALPFAGKHDISAPVRNFILGITAVSLVLIVFLANKRFAKFLSFPLGMIGPLKDKAKPLYDAVNKYKHHKAILTQSLVMSVVAQILFFLSVGALALSIGAHIPFIELLLKMPIIGVASLLPSINGLGLREGSTVLMYGPVIGEANAFAVSVLWLLMLFIVSIIGGLIHALNPQFKLTPKEEGII